MDKRTLRKNFFQRSVPTKAQWLPLALFPSPARNNLPHVSTPATLMNIYRGYEATAEMSTSLK